MSSMTSPAEARPTIEVTALSKWFGNVVAVNDVSLQVYPGITGLLGPNGAGKTTLLHVIAGLAAPSDGEVEVLGEQVRDNHRLYSRIGVMSEHEAVYPFHTGRQFVEFAANLYGIAAVGASADRAIAAVGLTEVEGRSLGGYSRGMKQRIRLAATLVHDPEVLLLDEPLNGTDPRQRLEFHDLILRLSSEGRTVVISSHILEEVEALAERILLMVGGKLAASGDYRAIRAKLDERPYTLRVVTAAPRDMAAALIRLKEVDSVTLESDGSLLVLSRNVAALQLSLPVCAQGIGTRLSRVEPLDESLESVFSYVVER